MTWQLRRITDRHLAHLIRGVTQCISFRTQRWHVPSQNHEPSWEKLLFARSLYQIFFLFGQFFHHNMVVPWHDTMPSVMIACFGFTRILKTSFSMFSAEPQCPDVLILFSFLAWDQEIHPRTQMWFFNQLWCTRASACSSILNVHINWLELQLMYKKVQTNPQ